MPIYSGFRADFEETKYNPTETPDYIAYPMLTIKPGKFMRKRIIVYRCSKTHNKMNRKRKPRRYDPSLCLCRNLPNWSMINPHHHSRKTRFSHAHHKAPLME